MVFDDQINHEHCYDNCIYKYIDIGQVLNFKKYDISTKLDIMYIRITEYFNLLLFS